MEILFVRLLIILTGFGFYKHIEATDIPAACENEDCNLVCQYDQALDNDGCKVCACQDPCADVNCPSNSTCRPMISGNKYEGNCNDQKCPETRCNVTCVSGHILDPTGCPTCNCFDPCANKDCPVGEKCEAIQIEPNAFKLQCSRTTTAKGPDNACIEEVCNMTCEYGYPMDNNNCSVCSCADNPCNGKKCDKRQVCKVNKAANNYYTANCTGCPTAKCLNPCEFGYIENNGCNTCDCAPDPCSNKTCPHGSKCDPNSHLLDSPACVVVENPCLELECRLECMGLGNFNKYKLNCTSCRCENPCLSANCSGSMCFLEKTAVSIDGKEVNVATGRCHQDRKCPPLPCNESCLSGYKKDIFGCLSCKCGLACDQSECGKNEICTSQLNFLGDPNNLLLSSEVVNCTKCPTLNCPVKCLYGWMKCETCDCAQNPCMGATPMPDKLCQALFFPTYAETSELSTPRKNMYQDYIYLDKGDARCDTLTERYLDYFNLSDPLNCDSKGNFKPLQCSGEICWCLDEDGNHTGDLKAVDFHSITCGYHSKESFQLLFLDDMSFISEEHDRRIKIEFAKQLAELLKVEEKQLIITSIGKTNSSELKYIVLTSNENEINMKIKDLSGTNLNLTLETVNFRFGFIDRTSTSSPINLSTSSPINLSTSSPINLSTSSPIDLSTSSSINIPTSSSSEYKPRFSTPSPADSDGITRLLLLTILLPMLVALCAFMIAVLVGICVIKRFKRRPSSTRGSLFKEPIIFPENPKLDLDFQPYGRSISSA